MDAEREEQAIPATDEQIAAKEALETALRKSRHDAARHWLAPSEDLSLVQAPDFDPFIRCQSPPHTTVYGVMGGAVTQFVVCDPGGDAEPWAKKRKSIGPKGNTCWMMGKLNGVFVYYDGDTILMTTEDLNP